MKNYPLLSLNGHKQWIAWRKTYLTELNHNIISLWDYNNYFIPDYAEKQLQTTQIGSTTYIEATQLDYNEFYRATADISVKLNDEVQDVLKLHAGYLLVSKARNEGAIQYTAQADNYFVQPFGYGSFYIFTYNTDGQLIAMYDQYAEETYGLSYKFTFFTYYPRFLLAQTQQYQGKIWTLSSYLPHQSDTRGICTAEGYLWTDINTLKPMFFHFIVSDSDDYGTHYGEEIIVDTKHTYSINVDETSIAQYTELILEKDSDSAGYPRWPNNIIARVI